MAPRACRLTGCAGDTRGSERAILAFETARSSCYGFACETPGAGVKGQGVFLGAAPTRSACGGYCGIWLTSTASRRHFTWRGGVAALPPYSSRGRWSCSSAGHGPETPWNRGSRCSLRGTRTCTDVFSPCPAGDVDGKSVYIRCWEKGLRRGLTARNLGGGRLEGAFASVP